MGHLNSRGRRRFLRASKIKPVSLIRKLRNAKKSALENEKPELIRTHLRNMIIVPEMIGSCVGVYNGKTFNPIEIKSEMIGHYLGEFSITYKPVKHGRPGIGATHSSRYAELILHPIYPRTHCKFNPGLFLSNRFSVTASLGVIFSKGSAGHKMNK